MVIEVGTQVAIEAEVEGVVAINDKILIEITIIVTVVVVEEEEQEQIVVEEEDIEEKIMIPILKIVKTDVMLQQIDTMVDLECQEHLHDTMILPTIITTITTITITRIILVTITTIAATRKINTTGTTKMIDHT